MKKLNYLFLIFLLFACSKERDTFIESDKDLTVGTFNLEWLGDGVRDRNDRTESDYKNIAEIIKKSEADIMAVEEVENSAAMMKLIHYLPEFSFYIGKGGGQQNVGVIFKKNIHVNFICEYLPLAVEKHKTRPGLVLSCKKNNFDFIFMAVHLKSSSHWDNTDEKQELSREIRLEQASVMTLWIDSVLKSGKEQDVIIAGDFNETTQRKKDNTLLPLLNDKNVSFLTAGLKSCKFKSVYGIDQIVASYSASKRFIKNTERTYNFRNSLPDANAEKISDHCPVLLKFDATSPDND